MNIFNESGRFVENKQPENGREENIIHAPCIHVYLSLHANLLLHACPSPSRKPLPFMQTSFFMLAPPPSRKPLPFMHASYVPVSPSCISLSFVQTPSFPATLLRASL